jgi:excisionase family DNA binding protein
MVSSANPIRKTIPVETLAEQLGISRNSTYQAIQQGKVPGAIKIGRRWLIPANAADWLLFSSDF